MARRTRVDEGGAAHPAPGDAARGPTEGRAEALAALYAGRIADQTLAPGARMPSVRRCAALHGVAPSTVVSAYDRLQARGLVEARRQRGYFVRGGVAGGGAAAKNAPDARAATRDLAPPVDAAALIRGMFQAGDRPPGPGSGTLPEAWLDAPLLQRALRHAMRTGDAGLRYGDPAGAPAFRTAISQHLRALGITAAPSQIVSTVGATHALDIIARTLLRPGDHVLVDDPGWAVEFARLGRLGVRLLPVPRTADGPDLECLATLLARHAPRLYVTVSVLHNPTGNTLTAAAAHRVLQLADAHDLLIVEDDTYAWLAAEHAPRLSALDGLRRTVYVSGFSKILAPDWRVGFMAGPAELVERCIDTKLLATLTVPTLFESAIAWLLTQGLLRRHAERVTRQLEAARVRVVKLAREAGCSFVTPPQGLFGWLEVGVDTAQLAAHMAGDGWLLAPGALFQATPGRSTLLRVNFAAAQDARFWRALVRAREALAPARGP